MLTTRRVVAMLTVAVVAATAAGAASALPAGARGSVATSKSPRASAGGLDPYGPQGMNVEAAHSDFTLGKPDVLVAYIEGGINWYGSNAAGLAGSVYVNWHEVPVPCTGSTMVVGGVSQACTTVYSANQADYDLVHPDCVANSDCDVTAADWSNDPRVGRLPGVSFITPDDLIAAFSGSSYRPPPSPTDPAGYPKAISGWDFYDDQNDPATIDGAYDHSDDQMSTLLQMCPDCTVMPVKAGEESIDTTDDLARAWLFAAESGAKVIVSVTADLGYSSFAREVLAYVESKGIVVVDSSNDFDTPDHQGGMYWNGVLAGNGLVANTNSLPQSVWSKSSVPGPVWTRSDLTSWGPHAQFSVATGGGSTSESTPTLGGIVALLLSYGEQAYAKGLIPSPLTGPEAVSVLQSSSTEPPHAPAGNWDELYGYGMPNVLAAMQAIEEDDIPPVASISSPTWYQLYDPTRDRAITVRGSVAAQPGEPVSWQLQYGLGGDPSADAWNTISSGTAVGSHSGVLGTLSLARIPVSFWGRRFKLTAGGLESSIDEYTVTFRIVASDAGPSSNKLVDETRMAVSVFHDPTALAGFPMQIPSSGESQPALVDLQGTGRLDIVFGTSDGLVDAIDPATGRELPGWPVHTAPLATTGIPAGSGIHPRYQPIISNVAVGDLFHTGRLDVVATTTDGEVYAFDATGHLLAGWPQRLSKGVVPPPIPRPDEANVRLPVLGASAPPVLAPLGPGGQLDIVQAGWDGYLYAWSPSGRALAGWPVMVALPKGTKPPSGYVIEDDHKLDTPPAVAWFTKGGPPDLVIRSQYTEITGSGLQELPRSFTFAYEADGKPVPGWPVQLTGALEDYGSAQEFITEGSDAPAVADVLGNGTDQVAVNPVWTPPSLLDGHGSEISSYGSLGSLAETLQGLENDPLAAVEHKLPPGTTDVPFPFTSSGAFGMLDGKLTFIQTEMGAESMAASLLYPGTGNHINDYTSAWLANPNDDPSGRQLAGFPAADQGQSFLSGPIVAGVSAGRSNSVVAGGDASAVMASLPDGKEAPGFPKFTGGWTIYSPASGDLFGTGHTDLVTVTREGYLFAWGTSGSATTSGQWWRFRHDEWNSGNYDLDTRPPGVVRDPVWVPGSSVLTFVAPGGNWYDGKAAHYDLTLSPGGKTMQVAATATAGSLQSIELPAGAGSVSIRAVDGSGLLGGTVSVRPGSNGLPSAIAGRVVGIAGTPSGHGYWLASTSGAVYAFGDARYSGRLVASPSDPVADIFGTADGKGYWLVTVHGAVSAFGDAVSYGGLGTDHGSVAPIVGAAATRDGHGYWLVAAGGGVFSFGDARFYGSEGGTRLRSPIVAIAPTPDGHGYWLVAADGGVFSFGDARFRGSLGGKRLGSPIVGLASAGRSGGYWLASADGGVFAFDAPYAGSGATARLPAPVVGISPLPGSVPGYRLASSDAAVYVLGGT